MACEKGRISEVLERMARKKGNHPFMISESAEVTYGDFFESVRQLAGSLLAIGVGKRDRVGIWMSNRPEFTLIEMAANLIGAVGVPISTRYRSEEVAYILEHSGIRILFMMDRLLEIDFFKILEDLVPDFRAMPKESLPSGGFPLLKYVICLCTTGDGPPRVAEEWESFIKKERKPDWEEGLEDARKDVAPDELSYIQYTSGSTGLPKGVMYSHEQVLTSVTVQGERWELTPKDRMLVVAPFFHGLGHMAGPPLGIRFGATVVPLEIFDAGKALDTIERFRCTTLSAPPTVFQMMLEHPSLSKTDLSSLRASLITAAPAPEGLKTEIRKRFCDMDLITGYGATETGGGCTQSKLGDDIQVVEASIGFPLRTYDVKILDPTTGAELPAGTPGELCARGPCIMLGYFRDEEKTTEVMDDEGWFHTGDLAEVDEKGYFRIVGRIKELIITGGNNVYPSEVENVLTRHEAVKEAQVIGVPDRLKGEVVMAYLILKEGSDCSTEALQAFCRERTANYKVPRYIQFVEAFPLSAAGKVLKKDLKERAIEELGMEGNA